MTYRMRERTSSSASQIGIDGDGSTRSQTWTPIWASFEISTWTGSFLPLIMGEKDNKLDKLWWGEKGGGRKPRK